jgi:hypothetical protein
MKSKSVFRDITVEGTHRLLLQRTRKPRTMDQKSLCPPLQLSHEEHVGLVARWGTRKRTVPREAMAEAMEAVSKAPTNVTVVGRRVTKQPSAGRIPKTPTVDPHGSRSRGNQEISNVGAAKFEVLCCSICDDQSEFDDYELLEDVHNYRGSQAGNGTGDVYGMSRHTIVPQGLEAVG